MTVCDVGMRSVPHAAARHPLEWRVLQVRAGGLRSATAVAIAAASASPSSSIAVSRILNFWTLPVTVIGNESTSFT